MRFEETRRFPISRSQAHAFLADPATWVDWLPGLMEPAATGLEQPGDRVRLVYRLLGRRVEAKAVLQQLIPGQYARVHIETAELGTLAQEWFFSDAGPDSMTLRIVCETDEPTSLFGRPVDPTLLPRAIQADLEATLGNLEAIFALGVPDQQSTWPGTADQAGGAEDKG